MTASRLTSIASLVLSLGLYAAAYFVENWEAYLFPRLLAIGMFLIATAMLTAGWTSDKASEKGHAGTPPWTRLWPALVIFVLYLLVAEELGLYASSFAAFLASVTVYAPDRASLRRSVKHVMISLAFMAVLYSVFAVLLRVQTPRGILF
ncbi:MAG: tripartite tricarboxylate transporter TctB family protein [Candidatus Binatia bacterium]